MQIRGHAPILAVQRIGDLAARDRQRGQHVVQVDVQRIEVGHEELERIVGLVEVDILGRVGHEEGRVIDHHEVLGARAAVRDPHDLDRHAAPVALLVLRGLA